MLHIHCEIIMNNFLEILTAYVRDLSPQKPETSGKTGSRMGSCLLRPVGGKERKTKQRYTVGDRDEK